MTTKVAQSEAIDLSVETEVFAAPGAEQRQAITIESPQAAWTIGTTCWSCEWTCDGCDNSECYC